MMKQGFEDGENDKKILILFATLVIGALLAYGVVYLTVKRWSQVLRVVGYKKRLALLLMGVLLSVPVIILNYESLFVEEHNLITILKALLIVQIPLFLIMAPLFFLTAEVLFKRHISLRIDESDLHRQINDKEFLRLENSLNDKENIPLGISKVLRSPVTIASKYRIHHMMVTGSSGYGKTAMALTILRHDLRWGRPVIFIDPKANKGDIEIAQSYAKLYGREKDFCIFSDNLREESVVYNPLLLGDAAAKAEKICSAFELNHEHWGKVAQSFLITLFQTFEVLDIKASLKTVSKYIDSKEALQSLFEEINELSDSETVLEIRQKIPRISKMKSEELAGLQAGLTAINSSSLKYILNPHPGKKEVDLIDIIESNKFIYFDVEPSEKGLLMSQVGRFLIKDIKFLAGKLQKNQIDLKSDYLPVFIDEVDLFIDDKFHYFSKTARSANMALTVLFQSVSSLDNIGEHLKVMLGEFGVSMHFNTVGRDDLDYNVMRPGSMKVREQSHQIDRSNINNLTGKGTEVIASNFKLDPDVLRELKVDDFFIYDKQKHSVKKLDLVKSWSAKWFFKNAKSLHLLNDTCALEEKKRKVNSLKKLSTDERVLLSEPIKNRQKFYDFNQRKYFLKLQNEWVEDCLANQSWYPWRFLRK